MISITSLKWLIYYTNFKCFNAPFLFKFVYHFKSSLLVIATIYVADLKLKNAYVYKIPVVEKSLFTVNMLYFRY